MAPTTEVDSETRHDIYSLVLCVHQVERAWTKGHLDPDEYRETLQQLLQQYDALLPAGVALEELIDVQGVALGARRVVLGMGGTKERDVAATTGAFITLMDAIKLGLATKADLHPLVAAVAVRTKALLAADQQALLVQWLVKLNHLQGELQDDQMAAILADVENCYHSFIDSL